MTQLRQCLLEHLPYISCTIMAFLLLRRHRTLRPENILISVLEKAGAVSAAHA